MGATVLGQMTGAFGGRMAGGMLGGPAAGNPADRREVQPRQVPEGGDGAAQAGHTDYDQLSTGGAEPTALGLLFAVVPRHRAVVYEVLNDSDHATYVYDLPSGGPADGVREIAAALALIGYRVSAVYADATGVDSSLRDAVARLPYLAALRQGFRGRVIHGENWESQLDALLSR
jgi:hypothetical protein